MAVGLRQIFATQLHFNEQLAGIKPVDAPSPPIQLFHPVLKADQALVRKAKYIAQPANEVLRLAHFVLGVGKLFGEAVGAAEDFGPVMCDSHGVRGKWQLFG